MTVNGNISGSGALTKSGNGTLTLDGANTYTGGTTVNAGTLRLSVGVGFTMNIRVLKATPATDREPARIAFKSEGAPVGVPPRTSLTPPRSDDR